MQCNNNPEGNLHNLLSYIENTPFWLQFWCDTRHSKRAFSICLSDDILDLVQLQALRLIIKKGERVQVVEVYNMNKHTCNEHFFDIIDCEEKAYWLGYFLGDGCLSTNFRVIISSVNHVVLESFKHAIESKKHKISGHNITIQSPIMWQALYNLGLRPRKSSSLNTNLPKIDNKLIRHLIRGLIDSDGWVVETQKTCNIGLCGFGEILMKEVNEVIISQTGVITGRVFLQKSHWGQAYKLVFKRYKSCATVAQWLYNDATVATEYKKEAALRMIKKNHTRLEKQSSKFRGVSFQQGKWVAEVWQNNKKHYLGRHLNESDARIACDIFRQSHKIP